MENMKAGNRLCIIPTPPPPSPLHPSSHVLSLRHWKQRFLGDKLKYFIGDVTDAYSYRFLSCFFRIHRRNKDRPRLYRHHGFGSVLRRAVSYQIINFLHRFTAFDSGSTALDNYRTPRSLQSRTQFGRVLDRRESKEVSLV